MTQEARVILDQLNALLDAEKQLLLRGQLDGLSDLEVKKSALIAQMNTAGWPADRTKTAVLKRRAQENGQLYEAALKGMRRANARLHDVRSVLRELKTYSGRGTIRSDGVGAPSVSFKA